MKILYASTLFPHPTDPTRGTYNLKLCQALASLRATDLASGHHAHEVKVVAPRRWPSVLKNRTRHTLNTAGLSAVEYPTFYYLPKLKRRQMADWLDWSMSKSIERLTVNWKPDVVLSYWADPDGTAAVKWAKRLGAKCGIIVGGTDVLMLPHRPELTGLIEETLNKADLVATVSDQLTAAVEKLCPNHPNVQCLRQGVDGNILHDGSKQAARMSLGIDESRPTYVWVGRVDPVKNLSLLVEAFAKVRVKLDAQLVLVGDGPDRGNVEAKIASLGLNAHVRMPGSVTPDALGDWYRAADATVLSSHSEGLPNVLRESLACGRPFASVNVGGISEIGDDTCRILTPAGDADQLADAMSAILDPVYLEAAQHYPVRTWRDAAIDFETAFQNLLEPCSQPRHAQRQEAVVG